MGLEVLEIIIGLEKALAIELADDAFAHVFTVRDICDVCWLSVQQADGQWTHKEVQEKVIAVLGHELGICESDIQLDHHLRNDLGVD